MMLIQLPRVWAMFISFHCLLLHLFGSIFFFRLGLKSFEKDVSGAVMDIQADEEEGMRQAKAIKKWYENLNAVYFPLATINA